MADHSDSRSGPKPGSDRRSGPRPGPGPSDDPERRGPRPGPGRGDGDEPAPAKEKAAAAEAKHDDAKSTKDDDAKSTKDDDAKSTKDDDAKPAEDGEKKPVRKRDLSGLRRRLVRLVVLVAIAVLAFFALRTYVVSPYYIPSASMEPTLHGCSNCNDDRVLVDKISYRLHPPRQGDIVVFDRPAGVKVSESVLIKRIIAVAGDTVSLRSGRVYIDGQVLKETYLRKQCGPRPSVAHTKQRQWKIRDNQVFVMGDNRCNSDDSRDFGPIKISSIVGRAFVIFWPFGRFGFL